PSITHTAPTRAAHSSPTRRSSDLARSAEAVDLDSGHGFVEPGHEGGRAGDIAALLTDRGHDTEHEVIDGAVIEIGVALAHGDLEDRKSTRLNSSHVSISYAVFCLK